MHESVRREGGGGGAGASEASEKTKHWRGKRLFVNNGLPSNALFAQNPEI